jgi:hypothetical protein
VAALDATASVASLWPAGIRPLTETLAEYMNADDDGVRAATLATLVYVSRETPEVLAPLAATLRTKLSADKTIPTT